VEIKNVFSLGIKFFVLQLSSLILFSLGNILIYENLTKVDVSAYDIVNKIYLFVMTVYNIVISVFWTEISKYKATKKKIEMRKLWGKLYVIATLFSALCACSVFIVPLFIDMWTKGEIKITVSHIYCFPILLLVQSFSYAGAVFLNAFEKLKWQIILSGIGIVGMIPLSRLLFEINLGINSIPLSSAILISPTVIYVIFASRRCINTV
jgi:O-antigen/teichoic acid export membrane protein